MLCAAAMDAVLVFIASFGAWSADRLNPPIPSTGEYREEQQPHTNTPTNYTGSDKRGTPEFPLVIRPTEEEAKQVAEERAEKSTNDRHLVWLTAILSVGTLTLAFATGFLWLSTRRLAVGAEDNSERQLRAYVFPRSTVMRNFDSSPIVEITIQNFGQTPAYNVTLWTTMVVAIYPSGNKAPKPIGPPNQSTGFMEPGGSIHTLVHLTGAINDGERNGIIAGCGAIYLFGGIDYIDAFKKKRTVNFCYFRGGEADIYNGTDGPMAVYKEWNEAD